MPRRRTAPVTLARLLALGLLLAAALEAGVPRKLRKQIETLPAVYQQWIEGVELLISASEVEAFLELTKDYQRDAFIERFWRIRDPYPQSSRNELKERWETRIQQVKDLGEEDFRSERARVLLSNGPPDGLIEVKCADLWPGQVWYYRRAETIGNEIVMLFYQVSFINAQVREMGRSQQQGP